MRDAHSDILDRLERATDADGNKLFDAVHNERAVEPAERTYVIVLQRAGDFEKKARYIFRIDTTVELRIFIPKGATEENQALADIRNNLIEFLLNDEGGMAWIPQSYRRERAEIHGQEVLYEVLTLQYMNDTKTYSKRG